MLVTADWVVPVDAPPIHHGAVRVHNGRIADIGPEGRIAGTAGRSRFEFPGCVITPGLVNTHTHLSLTALGGLLSPAPLPVWLARLVPMIRTLDADDLAASAGLGALRCLESGVTAVGDIAYGPEPLAASSDVGLGGVFFWEVLGMKADELPAALASAEFPPAGVCVAGRVRCGISPHAAYSTGPGLLQAAAEFARERACALAIHVAESASELRLTTRGGGALAPVAKRLADGFVPPRVSPVRYLADLGMLEGALAVHCVHLTVGDPELLAEQARGVALCPRSNAFLRNGMPPVRDLEEAGALISLGTDSAASNADLDLMAEARALHELMPSLTPARLLRVLTLDGATALGLGDTFGSLTLGKQADLAVMRVPVEGDPVAAVVEHGGVAAVEAVMTAGVWRVRDARPTFSTTTLEERAAAAAEKARRARLV